MTRPPGPGSLPRLQELDLVVLDVDGVLTDGGIYMGSDGMVLRRFHVQDGHGVKRLMARGVQVAVITGHVTEAVARRTRQLGIEHVYQGRNDKAEAFRNLCADLGADPARTLCVGDDLLDLPVMEQVGWPVAVANATAEVRRAARYVTRCRGGDGAVREVSDAVLAASEGVARAVGVIPARYASSRFPGKPLARIAGEPMIAHVVRRAAASSLDRVIVATDDERILTACRDHGIEARMTASTHRTGTERVAEVARELDAPLLVNVQGDEPLIDAGIIDDLVSALRNDPSLEMATARRRIDRPDEIDDPNTVKVVTNLEGDALYFSRSPIPRWRDRQGSPPDRYKHIGIYAFRRHALLRLADLPSSRLEAAESLEQLRALENGMRIRVVETGYDSVGVDTPEDLVRVEALLSD